MAAEVCMKCGSLLHSDEIGLYKRLVNRGAEKYLCIPCLARHYGTTEEVLLEKIEGFRAQGCTLFA